MAAVQHKDGDGHHWIVKGDTAHSNVDVWWNRRSDKFHGRMLTYEGLVLRQVNKENADVIVLPLGMVYDLIDALNQAVEKP